jgi:sugar lactone lactonase YvrE
MRTRRSIRALAALLALSPAAAGHDWNGLAADRAGNLFAVDADPGVIWKIGADGTTSVFVDAARGAALNHPHHLEIDGDDRLWLAGG